MKRTSLSAVLLFLVVLLCIPPAFGLDEPIAVTINKRPVDFQTEPVHLDGVLMVPMRELFEAMSAEVIWVESDRTVVAYRDNMHLKLQIDNPKAWKNGKQFKLTAAPIIREDRTLVPIEVIAETFDLNANWNESTGTLHLTASSDYAGIKLYGREIYKTQILDELDVTLSIPYYWSKLDAPYTYGIHNEDESYSVTVGKTAEPFSGNIDDFTAYNRDMLMEAHGSDLMITSQETLKLSDGRYAKVLTLTRETDTDSIKQSLTLFVEQGYGYWITGTYDPRMPEDDLTQMFHNISKSFKLRNVNVDAAEEHYIEFRDFYDLGMRLDREIHSNMILEESTMPFTGTFHENHSLSALKVEVTHGDQSIHYSIPVVDNAFNGTIYTPFGLGKHNVYIYGVPVDTPPKTEADTPPTAAEAPGEEAETTSPEADAPAADEEPDTPQVEDTTTRVPTDQETLQEEEKEAIMSEIADGADTALSVTEPVTGDLIEKSHQSNLLDIMKFSLVNIDRTEIRYLIPTDEIQSVDEQISSTAKLITYNIQGKYQQARKLYEWMLANTALDKDPAASIRSNQEVFDQQLGSSEELAQLYTAYLRALGIPSRVMRGITEDGMVHYWNELYLNGDWLASDVHWGLIYQDDMLEKQEGLFTYFNMSKSYQDSQFVQVDIMPY